MKNKRSADVQMVEESKQGAGILKTGSEHADVLKLYQINFDEVQFFISKVNKTMSEDEQKQALDSLISLFEQEYSSSSDKSFEKCIMV